MDKKAVWDPARKLWTLGEFWFDEKAATAAVNFFPTYVHLTTGEWAGRPFKLEPWQANDIIRPLFGWKRADGTRRYRRCYVWVPRKNGKTELAAGVSLLLLVGDGEPGAEVYAMAKDKDQASIVFNKAVSMVNWSAELSDELQSFKTSIFCPRTNGSIQPLTGNPEGKHGKNMSGLVGDELHEWKDDRLYTFLHQSSGSRRQPLEFLISTAGVKTGYGWEAWDYCQRVISGAVNDNETLVVIYAADPDKDKWDNPKVWKKANPNYGISVKPAYLAAECEKAKASPRLQNDFLRYHLNWWTEQDMRWLEVAKWDECAGDIGWKDLPALMAGRQCYGGMDLSSTTDLTCRLLLFPPEGGETWWTILPSFYVPEENIDKRVRRDRAPYDVWRDDGALLTTPGDVIDYEYVKNDALAEAEKFELIDMGVDPFMATQVALQLAGEGYPICNVRQGFITLGAPTAEIERLMLSGQLRHGGHPVLRWCVQNAAVETNAAGSIKPSKQKSTERIDGVAALVTAKAVAIVHMAETEQPIDDFLNSPVMVA